MNAATRQATLTKLDPKSAWLPFVPSAESPWDTSAAAHLYRRAAFGASRAEIRQAVEAGPAATVDALLAGGAGRDEFYREAERTAQALMVLPASDSLPAWWLHLMRYTPHPLLEKTTLFWHGHFATSAAKVTTARLMHGQNGLMRTHALGKFGPMLSGMAQDPAMLLWLDSATNRKRKPNENFAREVMELFTLGEGHYTEQDIREAARAFTGWEVDRGQFRVVDSEHDEGEKTFLGERGKFDGHDIVRILLARPRTAEFLVRKLFRHFVSETIEPSGELLEPLVSGYREHEYDTAWLLRTMLGSRLFFSPAVRRERVKSPVDFALGLLRSLDLTANMVALAGDLKQLGQGVFEPPNVKGWDGAQAWINSSTLVGRANLVWSIVRGLSPYKQPLKADRVLAGMGETPAAQARALADVMLGEPLLPEVETQLVALAIETREADLRVARLVHAIAALPEYQLS